MGFPIYYQGQILFRGGKPAFSVDCCCDDVFKCPRYCICGCRWEIDDRFCDLLNEDDGEDPATPFGIWMPGPVAVSGFKFEIISRNPNTYDPLFFACGEDLDRVVMEQSGPSRYYCRIVTDLISCCAVPDFLYVPIDEKIGSCSFPGGLIIKPNLDGDCEPKLIVQAHTSLSHGAGWSPIGVDLLDCNEISGSGEMDVTEYGGTGTDLADWTMEGSISNLSECQEGDLPPPPVEGGGGGNGV